MSEFTVRNHARPLYATPRRTRVEDGFEDLELDAEAMRRGKSDAEPDEFVLEAERPLPF